MHDCCCIDVEPGGFSDYKTRTARKAHRCGECSAWIKPGERYEYAWGCHEGWWWDAKTCAVCARIRRDFFKCGFHYECLAEELWECYGVALTERRVEL